MKKIIAILFITVSISLNAQENISDVYSIATEFEQIELLRMRPGTDMLEGLNIFIQQKSVKNAVILGGIGSVTDYHYHVVSDKNLPPAEEYPKASVPMDLTSVQGYILNGRVHAHITLADENSVIGGHLESGTKALTFFILTIGILADDLEIDKLDDYKM